MSITRYIGETDEELRVRMGLRTFPVLACGCPYVTRDRLTGEQRARIHLYRLLHRLLGHT